MEGERTRIFAKAFICGPNEDPEAMKQELTALNPGAVVQAASADAASNELFVEMLVAQTFRAESSRSLLAKKPEIDLLLRLAGTNQISTAIRVKGAKRGDPFLLVSSSRSRIKTPGRLKVNELPRRNLTRAELARVERAALLGVRKA